MSANEHMAKGTAALETGRWADAAAAFEVAAAESDAPEALFGLGEALWWMGDYRRSAESYERAYAGYRRTDAAEQAVWSATWLALSYFADFGNEAAARGWIARAERVLESMSEEASRPMRGWVMLGRATVDNADHARARDLTTQALELGRGLPDRDLELCALSALGEILVITGEVQEGFALLDEAMAGTYGGEYQRLDTVVFTSCSMMTACELTADLQRATQWSRAAQAFVRRHGSPYLRARCRTAYGSVLSATGHWVDAERELLEVLRLTQDAWPAIRGVALARLAELRVRQGRIEEAEALLRDVGMEATAALPAAMAELARGRPAVAAALLHRRLHLLPEDAVMETARTLELLVEAHLAGGETDAAHAAADRLAAIAGQLEYELLVARAALASGRMSTAEGDVDTGVARLEEALERFSRLQLPWDAARVRVDLAKALAAAQPAVAVAEARKALAAFEHLGAAAGADAAAALLRSMGVAGRTGPKDVGVLSQREQEVLRLIGLGLSNPEIADRLVISRKTAAHHVSSVLGKLGLRNRAEAAAYATTRLML